MARTIPALPAEQLRRRCPPEELRFLTTAEVGAAQTSRGQARALTALELAVSIKSTGHNVFVMGAAGSGRHAAVEQAIRAAAVQRPAPSDWCYINRFDDLQRPAALRLPPGRGATLKADMRQLIEEARSAVPAAFESDAVRNRRGELDHEFEERNRQAFEALQADAEQHQLGIIQTPQGFAVAPMRNGEVLASEDFEKLPEATKRELRAHLERLSGLMQRHVENLPQWQREHRRRARELGREVTAAAIGTLINELRAKYTDLPQVLEYLGSVATDLVENPGAFRHTDQGEPALMAMLRGDVASELRRYEVNVVVDNAAVAGAPVIYERNPTHQNLIGRIENMAMFGALVTDFTMVRPGSLLRANGGFLILDVERLLVQPFAWEALKRALIEGQVRIESLGQTLSLISTVSLEPESVPLDVRVVLIGSRQLYYLLHAYDPDFAELFKLVADFDEHVDYTPDGVGLYAAVVAGLTQREGLRPFAAAAVARLVEYGGRLAADSRKLSTHWRSIEDAAREAEHMAKLTSAAVVGPEHIQAALEQRYARQNRLQSEIIEAIRHNIILIECGGSVAGQVNALSVIDLGSIAFGHPARITATVRLGNGQVVDIEREVKLGGAIHSKGVLILSGLLGSRFGSAQPLSLHASLVFEQSYAGVEGDSASLAETCALLSALGELPLEQRLAVTGSVNQLGRVQAVGGVNEKIEGFFDVCKARGLSGTQGVIIPASNAGHLMLREDVVTAAAAGQFHVYAVSTVDEAMELLTGVAAGERGADSHFPDGTINARVEQRLSEFARRRREFTGDRGTGSAPVIAR
jgi:predicted ATP-dependent protease